MKRMMLVHALLAAALALSGGDSAPEQSSGTLSVLIGTQGQERLII